MAKKKEEKRREKKKIEKGLETEKIKTLFGFFLSLFSFLFPLFFLFHFFILIFCSQAPLL
ncbi:hypothetical protein DU80_17625 [Methanosarcina mazei]|jgi:hypothetical protein|uniref:Uncharacterized protein n=1 Tax=Methanosarcina mazei TaxID=2209 RepID=A0A0F8I4K3_METMZ|nr:hypothetical protein DU31_07590 [Methanosarcina mazei]KKG00655.1 hypothetical protein DU40_10275 [Methanosarcina mazei]KKG02646.1 hypothetical protein DU47_17745 [Methanosarcina mazei]KKG19146.1 hypothetical protein DU34_00760 [Methanosarcina mazei]KKG32685.1 hypothetical protein DU49_19400 [Methanosarcina mazei]